MSTIVIVSVCVAIAAIIGLRVYFEHKEEKELEKLKHQVEEDKKHATRFFQEEALAAHQSVTAEEPKVETSNLVFIDVEQINSVPAEAELKPKKKKRYYSNKGRGRKPKNQKQTKTNN